MYKKKNTLSLTWNGFRYKLLFKSNSLDKQVIPHAFD